MSNENGLFVKHTNCPACGSKDNLALYVHETENGDTYSAYCFGGDCGSSFKHEQLIEAGIIKKEDVVDKESIKKKQRQKITKDEQRALFAKTSYSGINQNDATMYRNLKDEYLEFYRHRFERDAKGNIVCVYYPETEVS